MTPESQRIAIAEACGYFHGKRGIDVWYEPEGGHVVFGDLPDYPNDLNAMHEAEKTLTPKQFREYVIELRRFWSPSCLSVDELIAAMFEATHATATQRAEAFLRTIGKWEEKP